MGERWQTKRTSKKNKQTKRTSKKNIIYEILKSCISFMPNLFLFNMNFLLYRWKCQPLWKDRWNKLRALKGAHGNISKCRGNKINGCIKIAMPREHENPKCLY